MNDDFENPIDKIIREARERGDFDALPGKGKPLAWEDESLVPDDQRMAQRVLKNAGLSLDWIELGKELDNTYLELTAFLERARQSLAAGRLDPARWPIIARGYVDGIRQLNERVLSYNQRVPHLRFQRRPYPIDPELADL